MYTANQIADWFLASIDRDAGDSITHLKLQKLVYYAQAWSLALNGEPLFDEDFQAWAHGPVVRSVFDRFSGNAWGALSEPENFEGIDDSGVEKMLAEILDIYGGMGAKELEKLTHSEDPWQKAREGYGPGERAEVVIPKDHMAVYYQALYESLDG